MTSNFSFLGSVPASFPLQETISNFSSFLSQRRDSITYFKDLQDQPCLFPDKALDIIYTLPTYCDLPLSHPILKTIEFHVINPYTSPIPPHQDGFYHSKQGISGGKILLSLDSLDCNSGGLSFVVEDNNRPIISHTCSDRVNFSSTVNESIFSTNIISPEYTPGSMSYHSFSSIHFSSWNLTRRTSMFLVFRYEDEFSAPDPRLLSCYKQIISTVSQCQDTN